MDRIYQLHAEDKSMTVTSFSFFLLLLAGVILYYISPKKVQWIILLCVSLIFYFFAATPYTIIYLVLSTLLVYIAGLIVDCEINEKCRKGTAFGFVAASIFFNIMIWFVLKGTALWGWAFQIFHRVIPAIDMPQFQLAAALGMGYYTAQAIGYIMDVYWGVNKPEKNPLKLFLFLSFFLQLTVGPISKYSQLQCLYEKHMFLYKNLCFGTQRIVWGLFKKLVVSERIAVIVNAVWADTEVFSGIWPWIAVFLYPIEIYADFSGCVDIVLGSAELFDITMPENFNNPFFSRTNQEFWQRWHITLGVWAKDYVYYPILKSKPMIRVGKWSKKHFSKRIAKFIPWSVGMGALWFVMGAWHGSLRHIIGVSAWYWIILVMSELLLPVIDWLVEKLQIDRNVFSWKLLQCCRTYAIFSIGCVFFVSSGVHNAIDRFKLLFHALGNLNVWTLFDETILNTGVTWMDINIIIIGIIMMLIVARLRENHTYARCWIAKQILPFRWGIWFVLLGIVLIYGYYGPGYDASQFIYQGF